MMLVTTYKLSKCIHSLHNKVKTIDQPQNTNTSGTMNFTAYNGHWDQLTCIQLIVCSWPIQTVDQNKCMHTIGYREAQRLFSGLNFIEVMYAAYNSMTVIDNQAPYVLLLVFCVKFTDK